MMSTTLLSLMVSLTLKAAPQAPAISTAVNVRTASLVTQWQDHTLVKRTYFSRSTHLGLFGFGWCTDYEKSLQIQLHQVTFSDCSQREMVFLRGGESKTYRSPFGEVKQNGKTWTLLLKNKGKMTFDDQGRLLEIFETQTIRLGYDKNGRLISLKKGGTRVDLTYNSEGRITAATDGKSRFAYRYTSELLTSVVYPSGKKFSYSYNDLNNLEQILWPDNKRETIQYDNDRDQVTALVAENGCKENYSYQLKGLRLISEVTTRCPLQELQTKSYVFYYRKQQKDGQLYLDRTEVVQQRSIANFSFDPLIGKVLTAFNAQK